MAKKRRDGARKYVMRGYIVERSQGRFVAVALKPYLVVEGRSFGEAKHRLQNLMHAYIEDGLRDGTLDVCMARKAPANVQLEYWVGSAKTAIRALKSFKPFTETCNIPQHA